MNRSHEIATRARRSRLRPGRLALVLALLPLTAQAQAQEVITERGGIANSGMDQGEALINGRSNVTMSIRGTDGTRRANLEQLTEIISGQMGAVRACYGKIVKSRPTTVGGLAMRVTLAKGKKPRHEFEEQDGSDEKLTACIRKLFRRNRYKGVERPAAAIVTLNFKNTRAPGQAVMKKHQAVSNQVEVRASQGGGYEADYRNPDGRVRFHVTSKRSERAVEATARTLRDSFAAFLDCRRRAQKDGLSPAGEVAVDVRLMMGGKASGKVKSSTVAHERVIPCVERAFRRLKFKDAPAGQRVRVLVTYKE